MVNTNYHKSINKSLFLENYFDDFFRGLLLGDNHLEHPGFAIDILWNFRQMCGKYMEYSISYPQNYPWYNCGYAKSYSVNHYLIIVEILANYSQYNCSCVKIMFCKRQPNRD
jgi:hypothetical protein